MAGSLGPPGAATGGRGPGGAGRGPAGGAGAGRGGGAGPAAAPTGTAAARAIILCRCAADWVLLYSILCCLAYTVYRPSDSHSLANDLRVQLLRHDLLL